MSDAAAFDRTRDEPRLKEPGRYRGSLAVWGLLIAYASLYPFLPLRPPSGDAVVVFFTRPRYVTDFDLALNVLAYAPLGTLACLHFRQRAPLARAVMKAAALGIAFSFLMECVQLFIPTRIASIYDVFANGAGALAGALVFLDPWYSLVTKPLGEARTRVVIEDEWGDAGLVLAMLWLIAQLNPALPFFGAGNIVTEANHGTAAAILQGSGVALSICGFGLFISALLRGPQGALRVTLVLLSVALWLKFVAASFMLQPHFTEDWLSASRIVGLVSGILLLFPLRRLPRLARIYLALLFVLAGALFSKIFGAYSALEEWLKLFRWPHGQLASFATLTQFLHEAWPFLALAFLIALFFHARRHPAAA
ncbi:MAG: VanZ family protein [Burkholderiales bacterium]|nr:VanZ family protein [Burkholderiales bacterium]